MSISAPKTGHVHTAMMDAIREDIVRQHPGSFTEDTDSEIVIPVGAVPVTLYVKIDVSSLAEAAMLQASPIDAGDRGWRPIETVPTDGTRVMLWVTGNMLSGVRFGSAYRQSKGGKIMVKPEGGNGDWSKEITHWQPLPDPPQGSGESGE